MGNFRSAGYAWSGTGARQRGKGAPESSAERPIHRETTDLRSAVQGGSRRSARDGGRGAGVGRVEGGRRAVEGERRAGIVRGAADPPWRLGRLPVKRSPVHRRQLPPRRPLVVVRALLGLAFGWALTSLAGAPASGVSDGLVPVDRVAPRVIIDLRYASDRNVLGRALYPPGHRALLRREVAMQLGEADRNLREFGYRLVLLDAWRPPNVQQALLAAPGAKGFVEADPGRALHGLGIAVDVTLADRAGRLLPMPSAYDHFGPESAIPYAGSDPRVRHHLGVLQKGMGRAGFIGCRTEWWHYVYQPQWGSRAAPRRAP
jgi:D-alanyl-D-alanine dipeptidase